MQILFYVDDATKPRHVLLAPPQVQNTARLGAKWQRRVKPGNRVEAVACDGSRLVRFAVLRVTYVSREAWGRVSHGLVCANHAALLHWSRYTPPAQKNLLREELERCFREHGPIGDDDEVVFIGFSVERVTEDGWVAPHDDDAPGEIERHADDVERREAFEGPGDDESLIENDGGRASVPGPDDTGDKESQPDVEERVVERVDLATGVWHEVSFRDIKKGDVFRYADQIADVFQAVADPVPYKDDDGVYGIECEPYPRNDGPPDLDPNTNEDPGDVVGLMGRGVETLQEDDGEVGPRG